MRLSQAFAQRQRQVRRAARAWRRAEWIENPSLAQIESRYADDRQRQSPALRALLGILAAFAVSSGFLLLRLLLGLHTFSGAWFFFEALVCVVLTEWQIGSLGFDGYGTETATALVGYSSLLIASAAWLIEGGHDGLRGIGWMMTVGALAGASGAWRWGSVTLAAAGALASFGALAQLPQSRALWVLAGAFLLVVTSWLRTDARRAPAHRIAAAWAGCVAVVALLIALHPSSNSGHWIEEMRFEGSSPEGLVLPPSVAWLASALFASGLCVYGVRRRDRLNLCLALAATVVLLAAAVYELRPHPLWLVLTVAGGAIALTALFLGRWIERGERGERGGWTTDPLAAGAIAAPVESLAALATASLAPAPAANEVELAADRGAGGEFGGGGASGSY